MLSNCYIELFLILSVQWLLLTATVSASYTKIYAGYVFTYSGQDTYLRKDGAQAWCSQNGSNLLWIKSIDVQTSTLQFLSDTGVNFADSTLLFTSGVRNDASSWNWVNGRGINSISVAGQGSDLVNSFGYISTNPSLISIVASAPATTRGYICQGKFDCTTGFILHELCHKIYTSPALTWFEARYRCSSDGGDLASFDFINDDRRFNSTLYGPWFSSSTTYWIGIRRQSWMWQSSNLEVNYTNWLNGRPVYGLNNLCLCLSKSGADWEWNDCNCNSAFQFVCMTERTTPATWSSMTFLTTTNSTTVFNSVSLYSTTSPLYSNSSKIDTPFSATMSLGDANDNKQKDLGIGIGVGIGGALIIVAVIIVVFLLVRKRGCTRKSNPPDVILHPLESHYAEIPKQTGYKTGSTPDANYDNQSTPPTVYSDLEILTGSSPSHEKDSFSLIGSKTATLAPPNGQKGTTHFTVDGQEYAEINKEDRT